MNIKTKPEPLCPECGLKMILRKPKMGSKWEPFWGCSKFPDCEGTRQIMENGEPEEDIYELNWEEWEDDND